MGYYYWISHLCSWLSPIGSRVWHLCSWMVGFASVFALEFIAFALKFAMVKLITKTNCPSQSESFSPQAGHQVN